MKNKDFTKSILIQGLFQPFFEADYLSFFKTIQVFGHIFQVFGHIFQVCGHVFQVFGHFFQVFKHIFQVFGTHFSSFCLKIHSAQGLFQPFFEADYLSFFKTIQVFGHIFQVFGHIFQVCGHVFQVFGHFFQVFKHIFQVFGTHFSSFCLKIHSARINPDLSHTCFART